MMKHTLSTERNVAMRKSIFSLAAATVLFGVLGVTSLDAQESMTVPERIAELSKATGELAQMGTRVPSRTITVQERESILRRVDEIIRFAEPETKSTESDMRRIVRIVGDEGTLGMAVKRWVNNDDDSIRPVLLRRHCEDDAIGIKLKVSFKLKDTYYYTEDDIERIMATRSGLKDNKDVWCSIRFGRKYPSYFSSSDHKFYLYIDDQQYLEGNYRNTSSRDSDGGLVLGVVEFSTSSNLFVDQIVKNPDSQVTIHFVHSKKPKYNQIIKLNSYCVNQIIRQVIEYQELCTAYKRFSLSLKVLELAKRVRANTSPISLQFFSETALVPYEKPGKASISGQTFFRTQSGDVKSGAGCEVVLNPATDYIKKLYLYNNDIETKQSALEEVGRQKPEVEDGYYARIVATRKQMAALEQAMQAMILLDKPEKLDPRQMPYQRTVIADANGNFKFTNLPPGEYLVACKITWKVLDYTSGGTITQIVKISEGENKTIVLTR